MGAMEARLDASPDRLSCSTAPIPLFKASWLGLVASDRPPRTRASTALTLAEREEISRAMAEGHSIRSIASRLGRPASTVSRELSRNGGRASYRASDADNAAWDSRTSPEVLQTSQEQSLGAARDREALGDVVARTDRRVARTCLSVRREPTRVARDHLSNPLHPSAWRSEEGTAAAPEAHARHAPVAAPYAEDRPSTARSPGRSRSANARHRSRTGRCLATGRATCCSARAIARSPRWWSDKRATSCSSRWQPRTRRRSSTPLIKNDAQATPGAVQVADLGSRQGDGRSQALHLGD